MAGGPLRLVTADRGDAGVRLDLVLRRHLTDVPSATRTQVQRWIAQGDLAVNGAIVRRVAARAAVGDVLMVHLPVPQAAKSLSVEKLPLNVLYEDEYLLAVDKPAGIVSHPTHRHAAGTLLNALLWHARGWPSTQRPSLVSRLDKETSGIVIVAKTAAAHTALQHAMGSPDATKDYLALVYGRVTMARGEIDFRLRRDPFDRRRVVASSAQGMPSLTKFERLARTKGDVGLSLMRCQLVTGRTHQIRVHLAARGWPIVGDPVYGERRWRAMAQTDVRAALKQFPRQALHAWRVTLTHPITGARLTIEAPMPDDLVGLLTAAGLIAPSGSVL